MSSPSTGWKADPWIHAMAKLLLSKTTVSVKRSTARDAVLWSGGTDRLHFVQEGLRRWELSGQIQWTRGRRAHDPLEGSTLALLDESALRADFGLQQREATYQRQALDALMSLGVSESHAKALGPCLLGASTPPSVAARGVAMLAAGSFPSLRAASAKCFGGDSKFLDSRDALVAAALGGAAPPPPAPIAINAWLPPGGFERILFIENFDTFCLFGSPGHAPPATAVVYCKGFAGSSRRIRHRAGRRIFIDGDVSNKEILETFFDGSLALPCEHFGDLDWAGLDIFHALAKTFPGLSMWAPGCDALLDEHRAGGGHDAAHAGKTGQVPRDPATFTDAKAREMAHALAMSPRFVDQEFYVPSSWTAGST